MNVLMINGSPRVNGNTALALQEMKNVFEQEGIEVHMVTIGTQAVRGCIALRKAAVSLMIWSTSVRRCLNSVMRSSSAALSIMLRRTLL